MVAFLLMQLLLNTWSKAIMLFVKDPNNLFVYQLNSILSFIILSLYFLTKWKPFLNRSRLLILYTAFLFFTLLILTIILHEDPMLFNSRSASLVALLICLYTSLYYYSKLNNPAVEKITHTRSFWFVTGLFLYYGGSFFIVSSYKLLWEGKDSNMAVLWLVHNVIFAILCVLFSIGFTCSSSQKM